MQLADCIVLVLGEKCKIAIIKEEKGGDIQGANHACLQLSHSSF